MSDQVLLLIAVNGFVLAVLLVAATVMFPAATGEGMRGKAVMTAGLAALAVKVSPSGASSKIQRLLDRAGNPAGWSVERVFTVKALLAVALGVSGALLASAAGAPLSARSLFVVLLFAMVGFFLPNALLSQAATRRQAAMQRDLPDVLDLMSVTMRAGLGFDAAVLRVATGSNGPLAAEFGRMLHEFRLGQSRPAALRSLIARSTVADLHHVAQALIQADSLGVPIADVLTQQGKEMRVRRRQRAEERAQKVSLKILFPMLLFIFPALIVVVAGPAGIRIAGMFLGING